MPSAPLQTLTFPTFSLDAGLVFPEMHLRYRCYGELNAAKDNAILFPTYYTGTDEDNARLIGPGRALDSDQYFIIVPNLFGNGVSSSPSNTPSPCDGPRFPDVSMADNVRAQAQLLDFLGVGPLKLVLGWSMGGVQSYQWCAQYPDRVRNALVICGAAKTAIHNQVFLDGLRAALLVDPVFAKGDYPQPPEAGLKAFGRIYAGWAYSQAFYRHQCYCEMGFDTAEALLEAWAKDHLDYDANDLLSMMATWRSADISAQPPYHGDLAAALQAITANITLMPCEQDLYFRHEDNRKELVQLKNGRYAGYTSDYGHCSAGPGRFASETQLIEEVIRGMLNDAM